MAGSSQRVDRNHVQCGSLRVMQCKPRISTAGAPHADFVRRMYFHCYMWLAIHDSLRHGLAIWGFSFPRQLRCPEALLCHHECHQCFDTSALSCSTYMELCSNPWVCYIGMDARNSHFGCGTVQQWQQLRLGLDARDHAAELQHLLQWAPFISSRQVSPAGIAHGDESAFRGCQERRAADKPNQK